MLEVKVRGCAMWLYAEKVYEAKGCTQNGMKD